MKLKGITTMKKSEELVGICLVTGLTYALAQTMVTTNGGTAGVVMAFANNSAVGESPITISRSNTGGGATAHGHAS